jgi:hypothetical protein
VAGFGLKVTGAAAGFGEQRGSVVELVDATAIPDGDRSELPSGRQQWLCAAPNSSLQWRSVLGAEGCGYLAQGHLGMRMAAPMHELAASDPSCGAAVWPVGAAPVDGDPWAHEELL